MRRRTATRCWSSRLDHRQPKSLPQSRQGSAQAVRAGFGAGDRAASAGGAARSAGDDLRGFIADAKARPGKLNVASAGPGTISHLTEVLLEQRTGIKTSHIPFRGAAPAVTAVLGKHVDAAWLMPAPLLSSIVSGQLKALAVTGAARDAKLPSVPTAEEAGLANFQIMNWQGLFAPAGTPKPLVDKIAQVVAEVMRKPEMRRRLATVGFDARGDGPAAAAEQVRTNLTAGPMSLCAPASRPLTCSNCSK